MAGKHKPDTGPPLPDADPDGYRVDQQVGFFLRRANQRHMAIFAERMSERLTPTQWTALNKLREIQPTSQNRLGRETAMDVATIKGVIDRLVAIGHVSTAPDPTDGRRVVLSLTPEGEAAVDRNRATAVAITEDTLAPLTAGERLMLIELLKKIC